MIEFKKTYSPVKFYLINILLILVIVLVGFILLSSEIFKVKNVEVKGSTIYSDAVIKDMVLNDKYKNNGLYNVVKNMIRPRDDIPFVDEVKVQLKGRNTVVITVKEKKLAGYLAEGDKYVYFDEDAIVREISEAKVEKDEIIETQGLKVKDSVIGKELQTASGRSKALSIIYKNMISRRIPISLIKFDESDGTIMIRSKKIDVMLGTKTNLEEKLRRLSYILPKLKKESGVLHLEDFSEENTDIVFEEK
ncbi:MAG: FtsQ-type POTRA domain-containing protein [Lachnospiraceae bacterium]|nr:FtsQ-type POTRA domain-containing protein [Lachnospiraceae bacterium]